MPWFEQDRGGRLLPVVLLGVFLACGDEPTQTDADPGSLCACREIEGGMGDMGDMGDMAVTQCCFDHGVCADQPEGPRRCECDAGALGETCSTPGPGIHPVRPRECVADDPGCTQTFQFVVVERFDACLDLDGQAFDSVIVRPAAGPDGGWPSGGPRPVAVLTHGAGQNLGDYYDLLEHLAANGIVVAAFDATLAQDVTFRANRLLSYLQCLRGQWPDADQLADQLALIGHSRGGAAVAVAANAIAAGLAGDGVEVLAVVALAPSKPDEPPLAAAATPSYFVLQGSRDPDTQGDALGWFDQAGEGAPGFVRSLAWVFGATHQRFHQGLLFAGSGELEATLDSEQHWTLARAYVGGFVFWRLLGRTDYRRFFVGQAVPASVAASWDGPPGVFAGLTDGVDGRYVVHDFAGDALSPTPSGVSVTVSGWDEVSVGPVAELDAPWSAAHLARGVRLDTSTGQPGSIVWQLPVGDQDLSSFATLSLGLARTFDSDAQVCAESTGLGASGLSVALTDGASTVAVPLAELGLVGRVDAPDRFTPETFGSWTTPSCHALDFARPVRIPLQRFCDGGIDPTAVSAVELRVDGSPAGGVLVTEVLFERGEGEPAGCL